VDGADGADGARAGPTGRFLGPAGGLARQLQGWTVWKTAQACWVCRGRAVSSRPAPRTRPSVGIAIVPLHIPAWFHQHQTTVTELRSTHHGTSLVVDDFCSILGRRQDRLAALSLQRVWRVLQAKSIRLRETRGCAQRDCAASTGPFVGLATSLGSGTQGLIE